MRAGCRRRNHEPVTATPTLYRRPDHGRLGGVASGIAEHLGVSTRLVRVGFVALAIAGGLGLALYAAYLIVLPLPPGVERGRYPRWVEYVVTALAGLVAAATVASSLPSGGLVVPALLACVGGALI